MKPCALCPSPGQELVAPHAGARVETAGGKLLDGHGVQSPPTRGRELKL